MKTWALLGVVLLVSGCDKKPEGPAAASSGATTTAAPGPTIKGTLNGKPFEAKVALLEIDKAENTGKLHLKPGPSTCSMGDLLKDEDVSVQTPGPNKGVTALDGDKAYGELMWHKQPGSTSTAVVKTGEIEWIAIPTANAKGSVRVKITKDADTKIEGTMDVTLCK